MTTVAVATVAGICVQSLGTWLVRSFGIVSRSSIATYVPLTLAILAYVVVAIRGFGNREHSLAGFGLAFVAGLVILVLIGEIGSEVIHCAHDRTGCVIFFVDRPLNSRPAQSRRNWENSRAAKRSTVRDAYG